jgi:hypothetical protein
LYQVPTSNADCGVGYLYDATKAAASCDDKPRCAFPEDKAACCKPDERTARWCFYEGDGVCDEGVGCNWGTDLQDCRPAGVMVARRDANSGGSTRPPWPRDCIGFLPTSRCNLRGI